MKYDGIICNKFTKRYAIWNGISRLDNPLHILLRRQKLFQGMIVNTNKDDNLGKKVLTPKKERKKNTFKSYYTKKSSTKHLLLKRLSDNATDQYMS